MPLCTAAEEMQAPQEEIKLLTGSMQSWSLIRHSAQQILWVWFRVMWSRSWRKEGISSRRSLTMGQRMRLLRRTDRKTSSTWYFFHPRPIKRANEGTVLCYPCTPMEVSPVVSEATEVLDEEAPQDVYIRGDERTSMSLGLKNLMTNAKPGSSDDPQVKRVMAARRSASVARHHSGFALSCW